MLADLITSFILGLLTPLGAVCVLPLYPGFLSYLANQTNKKVSIAKLGIFVSLGVIICMLIIGLLFTTILQRSLTGVIGILSPIAFFILIAISISLIFDFNLFKNSLGIKIPSFKSPYTNSFFYGLFFGLIVVPCNPAFIAALFAKSLLMARFIENILNFLFFGIGMAAPLLLFSILSERWSDKVIKFLTDQKRKINLIAGIIMLIISIYYVLFVFHVFG